MVLAQCHISIHPNVLLSNIAIYFDVYAMFCCCSAGCYDYYTTGNNDRFVLYALSWLLLTDVIVWYIKKVILHNVTSPASHYAVE